jgi:hypothetical protein
MALPLSIGDILAVENLAWSVYKKCKAAPGDFQELTREVKYSLSSLSSDLKT